METNKIYMGDAKEVLAIFPNNSIDCCITSPPYYGLRDYGVDGQIGLEQTPAQYIEKLLEVFDEVYRVLKPSATCWLNIGDSYAGSGRGAGMVKTSGRQPQASIATSRSNKPYKSAECKPKDLIGIPWMLAFALRERGWYLRQEIIWHKPNPMPESVRDRCTKSHESIFLLSKSPRYYYDYKSIMEPAKYDGRKDIWMKGSPKYQRHVTGLSQQSIACGTHPRWKQVDGKFMRNKRDVWTVQTRAFAGAHFATFPPALITDCIKAGCPEQGIVLDPFLGSGTTALVAEQLCRQWVGIELNPQYCELARERLQSKQTA